MRRDAERRLAELASAQHGVFTRADARQAKLSDAAWDPGSRPTDSDMETLLLQALRDHSLPQPSVQYEVRDANGVLIARPDLAYPSHRIAMGGEICSQIRSIMRRTA